MEFIGDIVRNGMLSIPEIWQRRRSGEISVALAQRALSGRIAQECADRLADGDAARNGLLDYVEEVEDWFHRQFMRSAA